MTTFKVGDKVKRERRRTIYRGFEITLREGTVLALEGDVAVIKPPNKYAKRCRVHVSRLRLQRASTTMAAG